MMTPTISAPSVMNSLVVNFTSKVTHSPVISLYLKQNYLLLLPSNYMLIHVYPKVRVCLASLVHVIQAVVLERIFNDDYL